MCQLWRSIVCQHQTALSIVLPPRGVAPTAEQCLLAATARRPHVERLSIAAHDRACYATLLSLLRLLPGVRSLTWEERSGSGDGSVLVPPPELPAVRPPQG